MTSLVKHGATYDDLLQVPDHRVAEILGGDLYVSPRPPSLSALAKSVLAAELGVAFGRQRADWWLLHEPELHLAEDVVVPDIVGWRRDTMPVFPDAPWFTQAPDWVCEVLSPGMEALDRTRKMPVYAREEVPHLWLVNPLARTLEVYGLAGGRWVLLATHEGEARVRAEPFDAIELELASLWGDSEPIP